MIYNSKYCFIDQITHSIIHFNPFFKVIDFDYFRDYIRVILCFNLESNVVIPLIIIFLMENLILHLLFNYLEL